MVGSLGTTLFGIIRHQALSNTGVPLGLLGAGIRFSQLSYFWSPAYLFGAMGIVSWLKRLLTMAFIAVCGLLAVTAGPASALLMIPALRDQWPAGSTGFWLVGTKDSLWPDHLTLEHIGGEMCRSPTSDNLTLSPLQMSGCIWHGYSELAEGLKDRHFDWQSNITLNDGVVKRQITRQQYIASGTETWAVGVHIATAWYSRILADEWFSALTWGSAGKQRKYSHYLNATIGAGVANVPSWLPVVRSDCFRWNDIGNLTGPTNFEVSLDIFCGNQQLLRFILTKHSCLRIPVEELRLRAQKRDRMIVLL
jgi:hypothetical protein